MKKLLAAILVIIVIFGITCYKELLTNNLTYDEIKQCSTSYTLRDDIDSETILSKIYGEYIFKDSLEEYSINISQYGMYFMMKEIPGGNREIYDSGLLYVSVIPGHINFSADKNIFLNGEVYFCKNVLVNATTKVKAYLICKCIL
jgi:hypothetical protein